MATRLDNLVLVLAPGIVGKYAVTDLVGEHHIRREVAETIVTIAREIETAIADEELRQMQPPTGGPRG